MVLWVTGERICLAVAQVNCYSGAKGGQPHVTIHGQFKEEALLDGRSSMANIDI